jgi:hypothetical protein
MLKVNARQCAVDEAKKGGNPTLAVAWAIIYLADQQKGKAA